MLKVRNMTKSFGNKNILDNLELNIKKGEIIVIVGSSGEGKTTLLRCINGLEKCDDGYIEIDNRVFCKNGKYIQGKELLNIRKDIGVVFQNFNLFPHMSITENIIEAPITVLKRNRSDVISESRSILKILSLEGLENKYPFSLSGGQKQRVAIGRALIMKPKVLCFDEPTSALDPKITMEIKDIIKNLSNEGISIMIITHDMKFAKEVSDKMYKLEEGILKEI